MQGCRDITHRDNHKEVLGRTHRGVGITHTEVVGISHTG